MKLRNRREAGEATSGTPTQLPPAEDTLRRRPLVTFSSGSWSCASAQPRLHRNYLVLRARRGRHLPGHLLQEQRIGQRRGCGRPGHLRGPRGAERERARFQGKWDMVLVCEKWNEDARVR
ncbi:hypothetical protein E2C01_023331 [Portunus trituberculatus]|uniref:Uncharacterized protein n=1 Tax=Portunus trituberculatus TaxID=210409 RepID=A0A5B7E9R0_PORTR|nr:hypothetical protein [Portunus trituberculatus]